MRLGVPYRAGLLIGMALRYVGVFYGSFGVIMDAQAARGWISPRVASSSACGPTCRCWCPC